MHRDADWPRDKRRKRSPKCNTRKIVKRTVRPSNWTKGLKKVIEAQHKNCDGSMYGFREPHNLCIPHAPSTNHTCSAGRCAYQARRHLPPSARSFSRPANEPQRPAVSGQRWVPPGRRPQHLSHGCDYRGAQHSRAPHKNTALPPPPPRRKDNGPGDLSRRRGERNEERAAARLCDCLFLSVGRCVGRSFREIAE